ncbi:Xaa-Pro peptidase family protein [Bradyrhizobium sp. CCGUVB1N3]|uniref:M24 family metallopeptidase n=1 Tax=Bradyrhizobium sp. CCGUVB1N3 TaxID=2949629 RepID=UPI0020B41C4D|nr:Xaa-Pro peptidase family protein [Bradyrhizobium sp. CCGUVB1N3]MCP3468834.1 Xaa-Pro peptidase family protein [Bradyrhizobium sp. CCGUVB1N3]
MSFPIDEYQARVARARQHMSARNIDVLIIDQSEFLVYLTGFPISENMYRACLLPREGEPIMILRAVDLGPFTENSWVTDSVAFADWEDPIQVLADTIARLGYARARVGIDEESYCMPLRRFKKLAGRLPDANFVDFSGVMATLRARKSEREIAVLRRAAKIGDLGIAAALKTAGSGRSARDVAAAVHQVFLQEGADAARAGIITKGVGNAFLHGGLTKQPLAEGDILHMELLPYVDGYSARLMRSAVIGEITSQRSHLAKRLIEIQDLQFDAVKPGAAAAAVDAVARNAMLAEGLRPNYPNITGYALGCYPLHTPRTSDFSRIFLPTADWTLEEGMVFHMYVSADGIAISETVLVTETGHECLTRCPRQVFQV